MRRKKAIICNVMARVMGQDLFSTLSYNRNDIARSSAAKGKLLLSIPDNKDLDILSDPLLFNISGGDWSTIRSLYEQPETIKHTAKIIITSNYKPRIDLSLDFNQIRYMFCEITKKLEKIQDAEDRLFREFHGFINSCHKEFSKNV